MTNTRVAEISGDANQYMTSLELVDYINAGRKEKAEAAGKPFPSKGHAELQHRSFIKKIESHPGIQPAKFFAGYLDEKGEKRKCYNLPEREARLMVMAESLEVQTKVLDRLIEIEAQTKPQPTLGTGKYTSIGEALVNAVRNQEYDSAKELDAMLDKLDFGPAARTEGVPEAVIRRRIAIHTAATVRLDHIARGEHAHDDSVREVLKLAQSTVLSEDAQSRAVAQRRHEALLKQSYHQLLANDMLEKHKH